MKIAIVSLGCPKNQVDADVFCRALLEAGHETVPDVALADVAIVNTCGFIESAKLEAIEEILSAARCKRENPGLKLVVTGCLAERYKGEVADEMPEVDAVVGIGANAELPRIIDELCAESANAIAVADKETVERYGEKTALVAGGRRVISTPGHYAWLKIAEGCSNNCSYCAIPSIRGPLRSRALADCVAEAKWLAEQGVVEIVLVAQDVTAYGLDIPGGPRLPDLLDALEAVEGVEWVRLLYAYPERIDAAILDAVKRNSKVLHYFDIPIQHINDEILASMKRRGDGASIRRAIEQVRCALPDATLRTTLIAGYPGETDAQFEELCAFVREAKFDRLGCFAYSPEEGTAAAVLPGLPDEDVRNRRAETIMDIQSRVSEEKQRALAGQTIEVLCDGYDEERGVWLCRGAGHAPEIDEGVLVTAEDGLEQGAFYKVQVTGADAYDLFAQPV